MSNHALELTDENFSQLVLTAEVPVLVDFWAPWCPPCRAMGPAVDQLAADNAGAARVGKLNVDEYPRIADTYHVDSLPTFIVFASGTPVATLYGAQPRSKLQAALDQAKG